MKFKLDENLGRRCLELIRSAGHNVETVAEANLTSAEDEVLQRLPHSRTDRIYPGAADVLHSKCGEGYSDQSLAMIT